MMKPREETNSRAEIRTYETICNEPHPKQGEANKRQQHTNLTRNGRNFGGCTVARSRRSPSGARCTPEPRDPTPRRARTDSPTPGVRRKGMFVMTVVVG